MRRRRLTPALLTSRLRLTLACGIVLSASQAAQAQTTIYSQSFDAATLGTLPSGLTALAGTPVVGTYRFTSANNNLTMPSGAMVLVNPSGNTARTSIGAKFSQSCNNGSTYYSQTNLLFVDATGQNGYEIDTQWYPQGTLYNSILFRRVAGTNTQVGSVIGMPANLFGGGIRNLLDNDRGALKVEAAFSGSTATFSFKVWDATGTEPMAFQAAGVTDTSSPISAAYVGFDTSYAGGAQSGITANVDDLLVYVPAAGGGSVPTPTLYADNANLKYLGAHVTSGTGAASKTQMVSVGTGYQATVGATTTLAACYDTAGVINFPDVAFWVDGTIYRKTLDSTGLVTLTLPASQTVHTVRALHMPLEGPSTHLVYSNQADAIKFLGFQADSGATLLAQPVNPNVFAYVTDSTGLSYNTLDTTGTVTSYDIAHAWAVMLADDFGADLYLQGHSGTGVAANVSNVTYANGGWPTAPTWFGYAWQGQAYAPPVAPVVTIVDLGINDNSAGVLSGAFQTSYTTLLNKIYAAWPNTICFCLNMPNIPYTTAITNAIAGSSASGKAYLVDLSAFTLGSLDGPHPNRTGQVQLYAKIKAYIANILATRNIKLQAANGTKRKTQ